MKKLTKYSACFATPVSLNKATEEMHKLHGAHLFFRFYLINTGVQHHELEVTTTDIMNACEAYNWVAGQLAAVRCTGVVVKVQLYK